MANNLKIKKNKQTNKNSSRMKRALLDILSRTFQDRRDCLSESFMLSCYQLELPWLLSARLYCYTCPSSISIVMLRMHRWWKDSGCSLEYNTGNIKVINVNRWHTLKKTQQRPCCTLRKHKNGQKSKSGPVCAHSAGKLLKLIKSPAQFIEIRKGSFRVSLYYCSGLAPSSSISQISC